MYFRSEFSTPVLYKTKEISDNDWSWLGRVNRTDTNLQPSTSNVTTLGQKEGTSLVVCLFAALVWKIISVCCFVLFQRILRLEKKNGWIWHAEKINPTSDHCFCSEHFFGGKKTFENNIPTKVPKIVNPKVFIERKSRNSWYLYKSFREFPCRCWKWTWTFRDDILNSIKNEITRKSMNYQKRSWEQRLKFLD